MPSGPLRKLLVPPLLATILEPNPMVPLNTAMPLVGLMTALLLTIVL
jgi:hypothetical protein